MITGTAYGVILNDQQQLARHADTFAADPYKAPPKAPVLYIKPRTCFCFGGASVHLPAGLDEVEIAPTVALLFARAVSRASREGLAGCIAAACLALDISEPHASYFRPVVRQRSRDGFLPLGAFADAPSTFGDIVTQVDGREVHRWSLDRLVRPLQELLVDVSAFMTLCAGDILLLGLPGDAPRASTGQSIVVKTAGLPSLTTSLVREAAT